MTRTLVGIASLACAFGLAVGCGGGSDTIAPPPSPYETEQGFCQLLAEAACTQAVVENCYLSDPSDAEQFEDDVASCQAQAAKPSACNPNGYAYRRDGAEACVAAVGAAYADGKLNMDEIEAASEACLAVYSGGKGVGASCSADHECNYAQGLTCAIELGKDPTCQEVVIAAPGAKCGDGNAVCEEGYHCNVDASICGQDNGIGETCSETQPCEDGAICGGGGTCEAKLSNGSTCVDPFECAGGFCVKAQGASTGTCGSTVTLSPTNAGTCGVFLP
jgi:hypothetical protein